MSSPEFYRSITFNPKFDMDACSRCMRCVKACGMRLISYDGQRLSAERDRCRNCRSCVNTCDRHAIQITMKVGGPNAGRLKKELA